MKYEAIKRCYQDYPVHRQCEILGVSESGYYAWNTREPSQHAQEDAQLKKDIRLVWDEFEGIYGAPRIHTALQVQGTDVGQNRVARLMRETGLQGKHIRKRRPQTTQSDPTHAVAPNLLDRKFAASRCDEVWLSDITYIDTQEGYLYLAGIIDMYSREIVGFSIADHMRTQLVENALNMALQQRNSEAPLLHHSDRGSQYTSTSYQSILAENGITSSMSRVGNCHDNAPIESFWATLKRERADVVFASHAEARLAIFDYIVAFYNRKRSHSALDYLSPTQFALGLKRNQLTPLN